MQCSLLNLVTIRCSLTLSFPTIQQLLTLAAIDFMVCLTLAALLHFTIVAPTKGNIFQVF
jgi:hypothetical protein